MYNFPVSAPTPNIVFMENFDGVTAPALPADGWRPMPAARTGFCGDLDYDSGYSA